MVIYYQTPKGVVVEIVTVVIVTVMQLEKVIMFATKHIFYAYDVIQMYYFYDHKQTIKLFFTDV